MILVSLLILWALLKTLWGRGQLLFTLFYRFKNTFSHKTPRIKTSRDRIALLIPAHNEVLVLEDTINGAIRAKVKRSDIYVVDDSSTDRTSALARKILGKRNVLRVKRSGKAGALTEAIDRFNLTSRYDWIQIMDADSVFSPNYFEEISRYFKPGVVAVIGQVKSLPNNWITSYRAYEYTIGHDFYKYIQSIFNLIAVMPGPATCLSSKVIPKLTIATDILTEDFDLTVQIHHQSLGKIAFAQNAFSYTQDPSTIKAYAKQLNRWYCGFFQVLRKHRIGSRLRAFDLMILFLTLDGVFYAINLLTLASLSILTTGRVDFLTIFAVDFIVLFILVGYSAIRTRRADLLAPMPLYYLLRLLNLAIFVAAVRAYFFPGAGKLVKWNMARRSHGRFALASMRGGGKL